MGDTTSACALSAVQCCCSACHVGPCARALVCFGTVLLRHARVADPLLAHARWVPVCHVQAVRFLGVGKVSAKLLVASCTHKDIAGVDLNKLATKMMRSSKVSRAVPPCDFRVALPGNAGFAIDLHVDGADHCFMVVTPPNYPRRMITAAGDDTPCLINGACTAAGGARSGGACGSALDLTPAAHATRRFQAGVHQRVRGRFPDSYTRGPAVQNGEQVPKGAGHQVQQRGGAG